MNRDEAKQLLPIISAFADGATVQGAFNGPWTDLNSPSFVYSPELYRIKPAPKLRPWTREELEDRMLRNAVMVHCVTAAASQILRVGRDGKCDVGNGHFTPAELLEEWKLIGIDGARLPDPQPCGVRE